MPTPSPTPQTRPPTHLPQHECAGLFVLPQCQIAGDKGADTHLGGFLDVAVYAEKDARRLFAHLVLEKGMESKVVLPYLLLAVGICRLGSRIPPHHLNMLLMSALCWARPFSLPRTAHFRFPAGKHKRHHTHTQARERSRDGEKGTGDWVLR